MLKLEVQEQVHDNGAQLEAVTLGKPKLELEKQEVDDNEAIKGDHGHPNDDSGRMSQCESSLAADNGATIKALKRKCGQTSQITLSEHERYIFMSSMLGLLAEYGLFPHFTNASAISNTVKVFQLQVDNERYPSKAGLAIDQIMHCFSCFSSFKHLLVLKMSVHSSNRFSSQE